MKSKISSNRKVGLTITICLACALSSCLDQINFSDKGKPEMERCAENLLKKLSAYLESYKTSNGYYPLNSRLKMDKAMLASLGKLDCAIILDRPVYSTELDARDYLSSVSELKSDSAFLVIGHPIHLIYYESLDGQSYKLVCFGWNGINEQGKGDDLLLESAQ